MADAIVRLKVESQEYDSKLKRAADQMARMEQEVRRTGASFAYADKEEIAFVQSLGQMGTQAQSAKQKMREYTDAITSLTATYRAMTDEEKNSDTGKALAASIDQIKVKAAKLKDIMSDTQREITNLASDTSFSDGLNLMTRTIGSSASAIVAWTGDSKEMEAVIKDLAKIGTTVAAVDQLTKAFQKQNLVLLKNPYVAAAAAVVALGVAIGTLIKKSQELSAVGKALQDVQQKGRENAAQEITRIETLNNILHDNTRSMEERNAALKEIKAIVPDYHGALTEEGKLINDNSDAMARYVTSLERAAIAQAAFDKMVELQKTKMEKQVELQKAQKELEYQQSKASEPVSTSQMMAQAGSGRNVYGAVSSTNQTLVDAAQGEVDKIQKVIDEQDAQIKSLRELVNPGDIGTTGATKTTKGGTKITTGTKDLTPLQEAQRKITELSNEALTADDDRVEVIRKEIALLQVQVAEYKKIQDYVQGINQQTEPQELNPVMNGPYMSAFEKLQQSIRIKLADDASAIDTTSLNNLLSVAIQNGIDSLNPNFEELMYKMGEGFDIPDEAWENLTAEINEKLADLGLDPIELDVKTGNVKELNNQIGSLETNLNGAINVFGQLGDAMQQIDDPGAKVAGIIMGAIANIAGTFAKSLAGTFTPWDWIAAAISGTATMISTIAAIKSATSGSYASGGIIPGNSYSGDNLIANVNSGELILNTAQQNNVASAIQNQEQQSTQSKPYITGDVIILGANNYLGRSGQGEIVTTSMLRRAGINL